MTSKPREDHSPYMRALMPDAENRDKLDFYPTSPNATKALLREESFSGFIWEPACGAGDMAKVLEAETSCRVVSSDIKHYGYGRKEPIDFLSVSLDTTDDYSIRSLLLNSGRTGEPLNIVTNPPFKHALEFAKKGLELTKPNQSCPTGGKVALLCRLMFLESKARYDFFKSGVLSKVYVFSDRVPFQRGRLQGDNEKGGKTTPYAWFLFAHTHSGPPTIDWVKFNP